MDILGKNGESLFKVYSANEDNQRYKYNAWLSPTWDVYPAAYKEAADNIIGSVHVVHEIDSYVYPVMFLYRHYLELQMKDIIAKFKREIPANTHDLNKLWERIRPSLEEFWSSDKEKQKQDTMGNWLGEFNEIDPHPATNFRYPASKAGNPSLKPGGWINLLQVQEIVEAIASYLSGVSLGLDIEAKEQAEDAALQADTEAKEQAEDAALQTDTEAQMRAEDAALQADMEAQMRAEDED